MSSHSRLRSAILALGAGLLLSSGASAQIILVPEDVATIQGAIDVAPPGASVVVSPGTYFERLDFLGKAITVASSDGAETTIIDADSGGSVARFVSGEGASSVLRGFTLTGATDSGVRIGAASPSILDNVITGNTSCRGGGMAIDFGSPLIQNNVITDNESFCIGGTGGGIWVGVGTTARIIDNEITANRADIGGGIAVFAADPVIGRNLIADNVAAEDGGGLHILDEMSSLVGQNQILRNGAFRGGGIFWFTPVGETGPLVVSNTIAENDSPQGSALYADGADSQTQVINNLLIASGTQAAVICGNYTLEQPLMRNNDVFSPSGPAYGGCTDMTGVDGNISEDPLFVDPAAGDFHLLPGSPAIDAGDPTFTALTTEDIDGDPRFWDGLLDCSRQADMGVDEFMAFPSLSLSSPSPGIAGVVNTLTITGAVPNCDVGLFFSTTPGTTPVPNCPGLSVGFGAPQLLVRTTANALGEVSFSGLVGPSGNGQTFFLQAGDSLNCAVSPMVQHTF